MARKNANQTAKELVEVLGGENNINSYTTCLTRLRVRVKDTSLVKTIQTVPNVMGVVNIDNEYQIILGPGFNGKVKEAINNLFPDIKNEGVVDDNQTIDLTTVAAKTKQDQRAKNTSSLQLFLTKFATIFTPLIPAFIGAGILAGIAGLLQSFAQVDGKWTNDIAESWYNVFNMMLSIWKDAFIVIVGWRTAEAFGGEGIYGAIASVMFVSAFSGIYTLPFVNNGQDGFNFLGIQIYDPLTNWLTIGFRPEEVLDANGALTGYKLAGTSGAVMGALIIAGITIPVVKIIKSFVPGILDLLLSSTLAIIFIIFAAYFIIIPASGILFVIISFLFEHLSSNPFGAAVLAGVFILAVVFGVHQGFIPVYAGLLETTGINSLFAVLAMGGAGLVGASLFLYYKAEKDSVIRNQIRGAILPGFLGIGEPLIYGVAVPRPKVFIASGIGAGVAGFFLGSLSTWGGVTIGLNTMFGPSGLLAMPLMVAKKGDVVGHNLIAILIYLSSIIIAYGSGFFAMKLIGTKGVDLS